MKLITIPNIIILGIGMFLGQTFLLVAIDLSIKYAKEYFDLLFPIMIRGAYAWTITIEFIVDILCIIHIYKFIWRKFVKKKDVPV